MNFNNVIQYSRDVLNDENYIFKDIVLVDGIDKDVLINNIMDKCAVFTPIDNDPLLLKQRIDNFFKKNYDVYKRLYEAYNLEYNPIDNYNRTENWTETHKGKNDNKVDSSGENKVSAFNSNEYQPNEQNVNGSTSVGNDEYVHTHTSNMRGNIGVSMTQTMLKLENDLRPKLNIYEVIANDFYNEFMIYVL